MDNEKRKRDELAAMKQVFSSIASLTETHAFKVFLSHLEKKHIESLYALAGIDAKNAAEIGRAQGVSYTLANIIDSIKNCEEKIKEFDNQIKAVNNLINDRNFRKEALYSAGPPDEENK